MNGVTRISNSFDQLRVEGRSALMPYYTLGYPDPDTSMAVILSLAASGADLIELGVPFSDPLADGPTIQASTQAALEQGMTVTKCFELVGKARLRGLQLPLLLMGYINPMLSYGLERYVHEAALVGVDGFIVPDLPLEEAEELEALCREQGIALVYLASPASTHERLEALARRTTGFLYLIALNGVTGARKSLPNDLSGFVQRARGVARTPLAVGFGISTPEQAAMVASLADGVIIGSALINAVNKANDPVDGAIAFMQEIRPALVSRKESEFSIEE